MKRVFVVTHGAKMPGSDPGLTEKGFEEVAALRSFLPEKAAKVVCGTGRRHLDVARALGFVPSLFTPLAGVPDSGIPDPNNPGQITIVLACGERVPGAYYSGEKDAERSIVDLLRLLPNNSVICSGRPFLLNLGEQDIASGAVYEIYVGSLGRADMSINQLFGVA